MIQEAQGFRESQTARARGEAGRFLAVLASYQAARDVTTRRMYLETMEEILRRNPAIIVDDRLQGVVPFLQLGDQQGGAQRPAQPPAPPAVAMPTTRPPPLPAAPIQRPVGAPR